MRLDLDFFLTAAICFFNATLCSLSAVASNRAYQSQLYPQMVLYIRSEWVTRITSSTVVTPWSMARQPFRRKVAIPLLTAMR